MQLVVPWTENVSQLIENAKLAQIVCSKQRKKSFLYNSSNKAKKGKADMNNFNGSVYLVTFSIFTWICLLKQKIDLIPLNRIITQCTTIIPPCITTDVFAKPVLLIMSISSRMNAKMWHACYGNHWNMASPSYKFLSNQNQFPIQGSRLFVELNVNLSLTWALPRLVVGIMDGQGHNSRQ